MNWVYRFTGLPTQIGLNEERTDTKVQQSLKRHQELRGDEKRTERRVILFDAVYFVCILSPFAE